MIVVTLGVLVTSMSAQPALTFEGASRHPTVYVTPDDVKRARRRIETDSEAKAWLASIRKSVAAWDQKDSEWVRSVMPKEGACFAYGFTGCPICSAKWGTWGGAKCTFKRPGFVTCTNGHVLPDAEHPDSGTGYKAKDGRIHYFVGSYNAWVVETLVSQIAEPRATVYLLTGDDKAGRMAVAILDEIARIYPSCNKGSWDYPSNPPSGRLNRPWYQVARVLVHLVDIYDRVYSHPALDEPSVPQGLTRRQNIERNLLLNGAGYCYEQSIKQGGLHNGEADYLRGVLAVGVCLGIPEYVTWPVDGRYGIRSMLANNVDRDGRYFETSPNYSVHTRDLYLTFSGPLLNYRGRAYPNGLNLYDHPRFEAFYLLPQMSIVCLGHEVPYGDAAPTYTQTRSPYNPKRIWDCRYTEYLATHVSDPNRRADYAALLDHLKSRDPDWDRQAKDMVEWRVFHRPDGVSPRGQISDRMRQYLDGSYFVGQQGMAVLRSGHEAETHAALIRFGPSMVHGHYDDLNVNYFARGYEMTYDIGYSLGSTHTQVGWAKQTVSHNTVVVDEKSQGGGQFGGSLHAYADLPSLRMVEASSNAYAHAGVGVYRRLFALADTYALDVFRVAGGRQHDLPLHALSTDVDFEGVILGEPREGSLAGAQWVWGELQLNDGDMKGYPNKPYWNPPPGNGYGFLVRPATGRPSSGSWSATWKLSDGDKTRFELMALDAGQTEIITAVAPGLYPTFPKTRCVLRRRTGEGISSCFVSVWQSYRQGSAAPVRAVQRFGDAAAPSANSPVVLSVDLSNGMRDIWCLAPGSSERIAAKGRDVDICFEGAMARVRLKGRELIQAEILNSKRLSVNGWSIELDVPARSATVVTLPKPGEGSLEIEPGWPQDDRYCHDPAYVTCSGYSRNTAYSIRRVVGARVEFEQADTILGRGTVTAVQDEHTMVSDVPHEYARSVTRKEPSGFFAGKLLRAEAGHAATSIRTIEFTGVGGLTLDVASTQGFKPGDAFVYHDVQKGDTLEVHHRVSLSKEGEGRYVLKANTDTRLQAPGGAPLTYTKRDGRRATAEQGRILRADLTESGCATVFEKGNESR